MWRETRDEHILIEGMALAYGMIRVAGGNHEHLIGQVDASRNLFWRLFREITPTLVSSVSVFRVVRE